MKLTKVLAVCLEAVGMCILLVGIVIEVIYEADVGFILITAGSMVIAGGGMIFAKLCRGGRLP